MFVAGTMSLDTVFPMIMLLLYGHGHCRYLSYMSNDLLRSFIVLHMPAGVGTTDSALGDDGVLDIDTTISLETTWHAMEDLVSMGLVRSIGIRYR